MKFVKINNFWNMFGQPDYKGLDINKFEPGSQLYPANSTYAVVATNEGLSSLPTDIEELTQEQYLEEKNNNQKSSKNLQDTIAELIKETLK
ncbi:hypothetical protein [Clostridium tyrobutyricum]|uniref:hypothetical protein n=1 Tax=Clostridium tyrobutyricum TaxID=1519 RepID=UPI001C3811D1|nr:hypothetical protein [Clostridium tyrobutyricum]MBV4423254.1 hypothetical protein [Clostridium tyrobutyricum]